MCGIAGAINLSNDPVQITEENKVKDMLGRIKRRGPDETGIYTLENACIGNVRLKIVGGQSGHQPIVNGQQAIVFNGEIFNYKQLAQTYGIKQGADSDTNVLFECLRQKGPAILQELNGIFGICFINEEFVYLIRDRYGEKPLYYTVAGNTVYFASEIKAFMGLVDYKIKLPDLYENFETSVGQSTLFENIYQVEPGTYIKIGRKTGSISAEKYYEYKIRQYHGTFQEQKAELRELVDDAIKLRLPDGLQYGIYISGGLDSSIITMASNPDYLFTYVHGSKVISREDHFADIIAASRPTATYVEAGADGAVLKDVVEAIYANDGPATTLAAYSQFILAKKAAESGLRVMLGGMGADEFFNGYARHAVASVNPQNLSQDLREQYRPMIEKAKKAGTTPYQMYCSILNRTTEISSQLKTTVQEIFEQYDDPLVAMSVCDANFTLPPLMNTDDRLNMWFGIESRSPLLDFRVVEMAMSLPAESKIYSRQGTTYLKHILREAYRDILPLQIYERSDKVGFSSHINEMLANDWSQMVQNATNLLQQEYPNEPYYHKSQDQGDNFGRWRYQILQLAITHLLFLQETRCARCCALFKSVV